MSRSGGAHSSPTPRKSRNANESAARDAALRVDIFKVADQQQGEIDARRQARSSHRLDIKVGALGFREIVEGVVARQVIQTPIEWVARIAGEFRRRHPHGQLSVTFRFAHRHAGNWSTPRGVPDAIDEKIRFNNRGGACRIRPDTAAKSEMSVQVQTMNW